MAAPHSFRIDRITISLVLAVGFIVLAPLVPIVAEHAIVAAVVVIVLIGCLAAWKKAWVDVGIAVLLVVALIASRLRFTIVDDATLLLRVCSNSAFVFFSGTLLIGPWAHFTKIFRRWYKYRRHLGVTTFLLALTHASFVLNIYFDYSLRNAYAAGFVFFGSTALYILFLLAVTSWDIVQKKVSRVHWNIIHTVAFLVYVGYVWFFSRVTLDATGKMYLLIGIFLLYWILVAPWGLPRKILRRVNGWKQLHVLVYAAYASVITHVWTGVAREQPAWIQMLFIVLVALVVGSHLIGWVIMLRQWWQRRHAQPVPTIEHDGMVYHYLDDAHNFVEGVGKKFDVANTPIAAFLFQGNFFAMSASCPHQGGPIEHGTIEDGYVVCPWHGYQWGIKDGSGPSGFGDRIPYYPVLLRDGKVYASVKCNNNCHC